MHYIVTHSLLFNLDYPLIGFLMAFAHDAYVEYALGVRLVGWGLALPLEALATLFQPVFQPVPTPPGICNAINTIKGWMPIIVGIIALVGGAAWLSRSLVPEFYGSAQGFFKYTVIGLLLFAFLPTLMVTLAGQLLNLQGAAFCP